MTSNVIYYGIKCPSCGDMMHLILDRNNAEVKIYCQKCNKEYPINNSELEVGVLRDLIKGKYNNYDR